MQVSMTVETGLLAGLSAAKIRQTLALETTGQTKRWVAAWLKLVMQKRKTNNLGGEVAEVRVCNPLFWITFFLQST